MMIHSRHGLLFGSAASDCGHGIHQGLPAADAAVTLIFSLMLGNAVEDLLLSPLLNGFYYCG